jgi:predicted RNA-binding Zn ribbon-like protein
MVNQSDTQTGRHYGPGSFVGGVVALDFLNTAENWQAPEVEELLPGFDDWLTWTRAARLPFTASVSVSRAAAAQFMRQLRTFRSEWRGLLRAELGGTTVAGGSLRCLNRHWQRANAARELRVGRGGVSCAWQASVPAWECAFHAVVLSAAELLVDRVRLARVHECPGEGCGWFFYDGSKNGSRRWCSMQTCGNVDKVRRFHARQREH